MTALRTVSCPLPCLLDCLLACLTLTSNRHLDCYRSSRRVNLAVTCHWHRSFFFDIHSILPDSLQRHSQIDWR